MSQTSSSSKKRATRNSNKGAVSYSDADTVRDTYVPYDKTEAPLHTKLQKLNTVPTQMDSQQNDAIQDMEGIQETLPLSDEIISSQSQSLSTPSAPTSLTSPQTPITNDQ